MEDKKKRKHWVIVDKHGIAISARRTRTEALGEAKRLLAKSITLGPLSIVRCVES